MNERVNSDHLPPVNPLIQKVVVFFIFAGGYFVLGMAGLQLQSAQMGVSPVWPASGFAFAMAYWFGLGQLIAIVPAMLALGWVLGVPVEAAAVSALGSMLEAGIPAFLMRRAGIAPGLHRLRDALLFIAIGPVLGPVISATLGTIAFHVFTGSDFDAVRLWLLWWLGNSLGFLLAGGFGLVVVARRSIELGGRLLIELLLACAAVVVIVGIGMLEVLSPWSPLLLHLLIPVFVLIAQRGDQFPVLLLGTVAMTVMLLSSIWLPPEAMEQRHLGTLYLDISLLWVVTFTGMVISSARQEVEAREQVSWLARHDPLTRLLNRPAFMERLEQVQAVVANTTTPSVLLILDLDRFKDLNDAEGHRAGDQVLRDVGVLLGQELRSADSLARLGGDEFAVVLEDCRLLDACAIAENIRSVIERYEYRGRHGMHRVEVSIGLAELTANQTSPEDALHDADSACYDAKRAGRNRVWVHPAT